MQGRDWTYQGNIIANNLFEDINTNFDGGNNVQAVYLDDQVSGFTVTNNTFANVTRAFHLGGGRSNIFTFNTIRFPSRNSMNTVAHLDNRGEGWNHGACSSADGILVEFLARVPYNTSAIWMDSYPPTR
jgi:hypothetical protein